MGDDQLYSTICRCCLETGGDFQDLHEPTRALLFLELTGIEIKTEVFGPKKICRKCNDVMESAIEFVKMVKESSSTIEKWSSDVKIEPIEEETPKQEEVYKRKGPLIPEIAIKAKKKSFEELNNIKINTSFKCKFCTLEFESKKASLEHHKLIHQAITKTKDKIDPNEFMIMVLVYHHNSEKVKPHLIDDVRFACNSCPEMFKEISQVQEHIFKSHNKRQDEKEALRRVFRCTECTFRSWNYQRTVVHLRVHSGALPFQCHICGKSFQKQDTLKDHLKTHAGTREYPCSKCDKSFTRSSDRTNHFRYVHKPKTITCPICDKKFSRNYTLNNHLQLHTGEKQFSCHLCDKRFYHKHKLNSHIKEHLENQSSYVCKICDKSYTRPATLRNHIDVVHEGVRHICDICGKDLASKNLLRRHKAIHSKTLTG